MTRPRTRCASVLATLFLALTAAHAQEGAGPFPRDPAMFRTVEQVLGAHDANRDDRLDAQERRKLEAYVSEKHGENGLSIWAAFVREVDTNGDGVIARAEVAVLGRKLRIPEYLIVKQTHMVPMSDGKRLATDVYLPETEGTFPVVLQRTPYNKARKHPPGLAKHGYAVVIQDVRGRFASEGENIPFVGCGWDTYHDGADTIAWVRKQDWCNGKIGTEGGSALGITQNLTACTAPEGLCAQFIVVAAASLYHQAAYVGGAFRKSQVEKWITENKYDTEALQTMVSHPDYDEYWRNRDSTTKHHLITVPAIHVGGWFDTFSQGTIDSFVGRQRNGGTGAKGTQKLVLGPWAHGVGKQSGQLVFPDIAPPAGYKSKQLFDSVLKGQDNGFTALPAVAYYVMGDVDDPEAPGNEWRSAPDWPIPTTVTPFYFGSDGSLAPTRAASSGAAPAVTFSFDPSNPCPTIGGRNLCIKRGPMDQREAEARADVVSFTTPPLDKPVEVTGQVSAVVHLASSAVDTDLSVRFCDVYPDGRSFLMADGMLRLRKRDGVDRNVLLTPNEPVEVTVDCWAVSVAINRGHRMRVSVTSSNYPRFDINPGTGKPWREGDPVVSQTNRIFCGGERASHILLPVVTRARD